MEPFEALSLCAEIAIAITGFSGVVLVLGERHGGESTEVDRMLFRMLFTASLIPLGIIAVAFILDASTFEHPAIWRTCSIIHLLAVSAVWMFNYHANRRAHSAEGETKAFRFFVRRRGGAVLSTCALVVMGLQLANAINLHSFWPVLVAIWWAIAVSLVAFVGLLFSARTSP